MLLVQAVLTALLSGSFTAAIMYRITERERRLDARLFKMEAAYRALDRYADALIADMMAIYNYLSTSSDHAKFHADHDVRRDRLTELRAEAELTLAFYVERGDALLRTVLDAHLPAVDAYKRLALARAQGNQWLQSDIDVLNAANMATVDAKKTALVALVAQARPLVDRPIPFEWLLPWRWKKGFRERSKA